MPDDSERLADPLDQKAEEIMRSLDEKKFELPEPPSTEELSQRIKQVTGTDLEVRERSKRKTQADTKDTQAYYRATSMGMSVAYGLLAIPTAFIAIAWALREYAKMPEPGYGLVILAGLILGFVVTVRRLNQLNQ
jgi:Flp pilus assembly protein TadB